MPHNVPVFLLDALPAQHLGGSSGPDLTRYVAVCLGLLALVALLAFGFRRLIGRAVQQRAAQRSLQVIDMLPLSGKHKLAVVRCYDRTFLIGVGEKELSSIAELDAVIAPQRESAPARADLHGFGQVLARLRPAPRPAPAAGALSTEGVLG